MNLPQFTLLDIVFLFYHPHNVSIVHQFKIVNCKLPQIYICLQLGGVYNMHKINEPWTGNVVGRMHTYGIKGEELAKRCGWSNQYLSMILNGKKNLSKEAKFNAKRIIFANLQELELEVVHEHR
jgi:hypothetical protein